MELFLIPLLPLMGAVVLTLFGPAMNRRLVSLIAVLAVVSSFFLTLNSFVQVLRGGVALESAAATWIDVGRYRFDLKLTLDQLSGVLMLVVTGVGSLIHVYSMGYMKEDPAYWRFFACLNFFLFAMSLLVLGASLPVMFIGWEGVGLASYLLIGFWYADEEKARAGKKAFITNRVGDFGFLIGTFIFVGLFGTADFSELKILGASIDSGQVISSGIFAGYSVEQVLTAGCLALFVGATGKSAQIPLYVWLPDAMAGPTPVSALIHAATMVTAGVYMIARLHFFFDLAPMALTTVAWVGGLTALFAATIGLAQNDIKKVLAYSTVSQLGYMFLAAGLGAYGAAVFHLVTHAFFKACLFLGSGAVIHALHGEQDMRGMGGLRKELPVVFWTFLLSTLALAGIAPLSGFFSKDTILAHAFEEFQRDGGTKAFWVMGFLGAGLTALYMGRLLGMTFFGAPRYQREGEAFHLHLPDASMRIPLVVLAVFAALAGVFCLPPVVAHLFHADENGLASFLVPAIGVVKEIDTTLVSHATEWALMGGSVVWAVLWLFVGFRLYRSGPSEVMSKFSRAGIGKLMHRFLYGKWFVDELYQALVITPLRFASEQLARIVDPWVIDGILAKASGALVTSAGRFVSRAQTGNVQTYIAVFVASVAVVLFWSAF